MDCVNARRSVGAPTRIRREGTREPHPLASESNSERQRSRRRRLMRVRAARQVPKAYMPRNVGNRDADLRGCPGCRDVTDRLRSGEQVVRFLSAYGPSAP